MKDKTPNEMKKASLLTSVICVLVLFVALILGIINKSRYNFLIFIGFITMLFYTIKDYREQKK